MFFRRPLLFTLSLSQPLKIIFILSHTPRPFHARLRAAPPPPPTPLSEVRRASPKRNSRKKKNDISDRTELWYKTKKKTLPKTLVVSVCANLIGSINLILKLCHLLR